MRRYEIYLARLDPVEGTEIGKTRLVVIVSDDLRNQALPNVVCCPLYQAIAPKLAQPVTDSLRQASG